MATPNAGIPSRRKLRIPLRNQSESQANRSTVTVGIRMLPQIEKKVKGEAERRGIPLRSLFEEMWGQYLRSQSGRPSPQPVAPTKRTKVEKPTRAATAAKASSTAAKRKSNAASRHR